MSTKQTIALLKQSYSRWSDHNAARLGASVAFYSILSFAPLLILITAIIGLFFGHEGAHGALVTQARQMMGDRGAQMVEDLLKNAQKPSSGIIATIIAFATLLFGASGVFVELQDALNIMWDAPKQQSSGFMKMIRQRLTSFGMVLSIGFLLLVSLVVSAGLAFLGHAFGQLLPLPDFVLQIINFVVSFAVVTALFALMFKYVPTVVVSWREVIYGAIGTAILFTIGKFALGIYLRKASVGSTYGAAGSLVAVVVWIFYSAQIFFFGAEFTRVHADLQRGHPIPNATEPKGASEKAQAQGNEIAPSEPKRMAAFVGAGTEPSATLPVEASAPNASAAAAAVQSAALRPATTASSLPALQGHRARLNRNHGPGERKPRGTGESSWFVGCCRARIRGRASKLAHDAKEVWWRKRQRFGHPRTRQ